MSSDQHSVPVPGHGQRPAANPQVRLWAIVTGLAMLAVTFVAVRELIIVWNLGSLSWSPWISQLPEYLTSRSPEWIGIAGVIAVFVGVIFVVSVVLPRKKRYLRMSASESSVWARPVDLARFSTAAAKRIPGVLAASSLGRKGRVTVTAAVNTPDNTAERDRILEALRLDVQAAFGEHIDVSLLLREATADDGASTPLPGTVTTPEMRTVIMEDDHTHAAPAVETDVQEATDTPRPANSVSAADTARMRKVTTTSEPRRAPDSTADNQPDEEAKS